MTVRSSGGLDTHRLSRGAAMHARAKGASKQRQPRGAEVMLVSVIVRVGSGRPSSSPTTVRAGRTFDPLQCQPPLPDGDNGEAIRLKPALLQPRRLPLSLPRSLVSMNLVSLHHAPGSID